MRAIIGGVCDDGRTCPEGTLCVDALDLCVRQDQLETCVGVEDGMPCALQGAPGGICKGGICIEAGCGDGFVTGSERCDGEILPLRTCKQLGFYNDGLLTCTGDCVYDITACAEECGDGIVNGEEFCEDGLVPRDAGCVDFGYDAGILGCAASCAPGFDACEHYGFFPVSTNTSTFLGGIWGIAADNIYAVGQDAIVHWNGTKWQPITPVTSERLLAIHGSGPSDLWAVGNNGVVTHFDGNAWSAATVTGAGNLTSVWAAPGTAYAVGVKEYNGQVARYSGGAWALETLPGNPMPLVGVWGFSATDVYAIGNNTNGQGELWHRTGSGWSRVIDSRFDNVGLTGIWGTGPDDLWIVGSEGSGPGRVFHKTNAGWTEIAVPSEVWGLRAVHGAGGRVFVASVWVVAVIEADGSLAMVDKAGDFDALWASSSSDVWALTAYGGLRRFEGSGWLVDDNPEYGHAAFGMRGGELFLASTVAGEDGFVQRWTGSSWTAKETMTGFGWISAMWSGGGGLGVIGDGGASRRYTGSAWVPMTAATANLTLKGAWSYDANTIFAVGDRGAIVRFDGASAWVQTPLANTNIFLQGVWGTSPTDVFAVGFEYGSQLEGVIVHFNGSQWTEVHRTPTIAFHAVWGSGPGNVFAVGDGGIARWNGSAWSPQDARTSEVLRAVYGTSGTDIYAAGELGTVVHYDGNQWSRVRSLTNSTFLGVWTSGRHVLLATYEGLSVLLR